MSIQAAIHHLTEYRYDRPVRLEPQTIRLRPAPHTKTKLIAYALTVTPANHFINWQQDPYGNWQARLVFPEPTREFRLEVDLITEQSVLNPFDFFIEPAAEIWPFAYSPQLSSDLEAYLKPEPAGLLLEQFVAGIKGTARRTPCRTVELLVELNQQLQQAIRYVVRMEPGVQTPEETLERGSGSCRDRAGFWFRSCADLASPAASCRDT